MLIKVFGFEQLKLSTLTTP